MGFKLTSISRIFVFPDKPETVDTVPFLPDTVFLETGEKFGTPPNDFIKVQLNDTAVQGWLKRSSGIEVPDPARPELDVEGFVRSALLAEDAFNTDAATAPNFVFADYVLALAFVESNMANIALSIPNTGKNPPSDAIGPLQITVAQWQDFLANGQAISDIFENRDRPSAQAYCASFQMRKDGRAIRAALPAGPPQPDVFLLDLFYAHLTGSAAVAVAIKNSTAADDAKAPEGFNAALTQALVTEIFGKLQGLVPGSTQPPNFGELKTLMGTALNSALEKAFDLIKQHAPDQLPPAPKEADANHPTRPRDPPPDAPASGLNYAAVKIPLKNRPFGDLIVARFAAAGYGRNQQIAAVANAINESGLNPNSSTFPPGPEHSFGLFQCNQHGGLGTGFTSEQLLDPETNIKIILREAKRFHDFKDAGTLEAAVEAFVRDIERPANASQQVTRRINTARKL